MKLVGPRQKPDIISFRVLDRSNTSLFGHTSAMNIYLQMRSQMLLTIFGHHLKETCIRFLLLDLQLLLDLVTIEHLLPLTPIRMIRQPRLDSQGVGPVKKLFYIGRYPVNLPVTKFFKTN